VSISVGDVLELLIKFYFWFGEGIGLLSVPVSGQQSTGIEVYTLLFRHPSPLLKNNPKQSLDYYKYFQKYNWSTGILSDSVR